MKRWEEGTRATRGQVKEEWKLYINAVIEQCMSRARDVDSAADEIAESIVDTVAEAIKRATGQELP